MFTTTFNDIDIAANCGIDRPPFSYHRFGKSAENYQDYIDTDVERSKMRFSHSRYPHTVVKHLRGSRQILHLKLKCPQDILKIVPMERLR